MYNGTAAGTGTRIGIEDGSRCFGGRLFLQPMRYAVDVTVGLCVSRQEEGRSGES